MLTFARIRRQLRSGDINMKDSRRQFLKMAAAAAASRVLSSTSLAQTPGKPFSTEQRL